LNDRWRILIVIADDPLRRLRMASSEAAGGPPRDVAVLAGRLLAAGGEVRVIDMLTEHQGARVVAREARWWAADLTLIHAGGSHLAADPVPDERPIKALLSSWSATTPIVAVGPLAWRYGHELLASMPKLSGWLAGTVGAELVGAWRPEAVPGLTTRDGAGPAALEDDGSVLPAWHCLPLEQYAGRGAAAMKVASIGAVRGDLDSVFAEIRHAVNRAGARFLFFEDRDMGAHPGLAEDMARHMFGIAPGVTWSCRVRANHIEPAFALALSQGACNEVLVVPDVTRDAPAHSPMDDPSRPGLEKGLEAVRVAGMMAFAEHVIGRPGHTRSSLFSWQRWFKVRRVAVRPRVRLVHGGEKGVGEPTLAEARRRAGCWDNELTGSDVEKAVRMLGGGDRARVGMSV
jgi:hypothetical protein